MQAAVVDPDVTAVMDGCGPATATTCLFQSPIVWHSVITVYIASPQPLSPVCCPFAHKRKRIHRIKRGAYVSSLPARVLPLSKTALSFLIFYNAQVQSLQTQNGKCLGGMATHFQNGISAWQHMCCLRSDGTPFPRNRRGLAASLL